MLSIQFNSELNNWETLFLTCIKDKKVYHHKIPYMASNVPMTLNSTIVIIQALIDNKGLSLWGSIKSDVVNILSLSTNYTYLNLHVNILSVGGAC